ncbi:sigma for late transcription [Xanthomonas phage XaC1]|nr:sigma for late transcription [Xanthomonas phage XaC1]
MITKKPKKKYLNNADLLREIQKSKMSYCYVLDDSYSMYDYIVFDVTEVTQELLEVAAIDRMKRLNNELIDKVQEEQGLSKKKAKEYAEDNSLIIKEVPFDEIVVRVITNEHVPYIEDSAKKVRTNFEPFKHYIVDNTGELIEVARSHWNGDLDNGTFSLTTGRLTNELGKMFIKLAEHYAQRANYRNYTYIDEMMGDARIQLVKNALLFNESIFYDKKRDKPVIQLNPFAYYTSFVNNAFRSVLNTEKQVRNIRDDLLEMHGFDPSFTRQIEMEMKMVEGKANRGSIQ